MTGRINLRKGGITNMDALDNAVRLTNSVVDTYTSDNRDPLDILIEKESRGEIKFKISSLQESLTYQQEKILNLLEQGYIEKEIADYMYISPKTIYSHIEAIRNKAKKEGL